MTILYVFLGLAILGFLLKIAGLFAVFYSFVRMAISAAQEGNRTLLLIAGCGLLAPLVWLAYDAHRVEQQVADRAQTVAAFQRAPLPQDRPRTLHLYGHMTDREIALLLGGGYFDKVMAMGERYPPRKDQPVFEHTMNDPDTCRDTARLWISKRIAGNVPAYELERVLDHCAQKVRVGSANDFSRQDAVVFLQGIATTLREGKKLRSGGNFELRLRRGETDMLIDYWENYYYEEPMATALFNWLGDARASGKGSEERVSRMTFLMNVLDPGMPSLTR
jgi:hypothetical protein